MTLTIDEAIARVPFLAEARDVKEDRRSAAALPT